MTALHGRPSPIGLVLDGSVGDVDLAGLCDRVRILLAQGDADVVTCDAGQLADAGLGTVAVLARLQLTARRAGGRLQVRNVSSRLCEVLALAGLCEVVGACAPLIPEPQGQAEHREEACCVEEERDSADPVV